LKAHPLVLSASASGFVSERQRQLEALGVQSAITFTSKDIATGKWNWPTEKSSVREKFCGRRVFAATPLTKKLGVELDKAGRVKVNPDLACRVIQKFFAHRRHGAGVG